MNYLRTAVLLAAMTGLFLGLGFMLGGEAGMAIALVFAIATNAFAYWNADRMVLRMYGAGGRRTSCSRPIPTPQTGSAACAS